MAEIDGYLYAWARWSVYRADQGLGYGRITVLGKIADFGPTAAAIRGDYGARVIPENATSEHLDSLIAQLPDKFRTVVRIEYLGGYGSQRQKARHLHITIDCFCYRLKAAKAQLAANL